MRLEGATVVITGASGGIGRVTAHAFADEGADLVLAARGREGLEAVAEEVRRRGARALVVPTDVSDAAAVDRLADAAESRFGRLDVWVNNAAVTAFGGIEDVPLDDLNRVIDVDLMGYVHGMRAALRHMRRTGRGVVVNLSSVVGVVPPPYAQAHSMAKAAIRTLVAGVRQELRLEDARDIHVVSVLPASIDTPLVERGANHTGASVVALSPVYPPERVARAIVDQVRRPRREVVVGNAGRVAIVLSRVAPRVGERLMARRGRRRIRPGEPLPRTPGTIHGSGDGGT